MERVVADLVQKLERRVYGLYRGLVVDNADPERLGRLKLRIPSLLGTQVVSGWAMPCSPYGGDANPGLLTIPEAGAGVWVEFEEGDLESPVWVGTFWSKPGGDSELPKPNDPDGAEQGAVQDPPTRKILKTRRGHTIQLEDGDGEERILICDGAGENRITLTSAGVSIVNKDNSIRLTDDGVVVEDRNGNTLTGDAMGLVIEDANGNKITLGATSGNAGMPGIDLNGGSRVCLEGLVDWLKTHQHTGNLGAPTPLFPADLAALTAQTMAPGGGVLSDAVKAK
jgi:uncharacterized protein involved in type VI secretion and phage assembly